MESGVPVVGGTWVGVLAPAGTPREIVNILSTHMQAAVRKQDVRERFVQLGIDPAGTSAEEFAAFLKAEVNKWGKVIRAANVRVEG
jgi:tripartite-type tricarboxylate transporter receptor subunit TctC